MPSSTVTGESLSAPTVQQPSMLALSSASSPTTAILAFLSRGSIPSFFSRTKLSAAIFLASALCSGVKILSSGFSVSQNLYGSSNSPSRYFASRILLHALSMSSSRMRPSFRALPRVPTYPPVTISMSRPAFSALADTSSRLPIP